MAKSVPRGSVACTVTLVDADWLASACDVAVIVTVFGFGTVSGAI